MIECLNLPLFRLKFQRVTLALKPKFC